MDTSNGSDAARWPTWLVTVTVAAVYGVGALAAFLAFNATDIVVLFLPAGVSLSALVLSPRRQWPWILAAVALAELTVDVANGINPAAAFGFALANTAEPLVGAVLLRHAVGGRVDLRRHRAMLAFFSYCVLGAPVVGGLIGASTIYLSEDRPWFDSFLSFWAGDGLGVLTVGGAVLTWRYLRPITRRSAIALLLALAATAAATLAAFWPSSVPLFYLPVPVLFWIAVRFSLPVMAVCGLMMTVTANVLTSAERGPWAVLASTPQMETATLQLFMGTSMAGAWFLAVSIAERDIARSATAAERAVRQRIQGLQAVTAQLAKAVTSDAVAEIVAAQGITLLADHGTVAVVSGDRRSVSVRATPNRPPGLVARYREIPMTDVTPLT